MTAVAPRLDVAVLDPQMHALLAHLHRGAAYGYWWTASEAKDGRDQPLEKITTWWRVERPTPLPADRGPHGPRHLYFGVHPVRAIPTQRTSRSGRTYAPRPAQVRPLLEEIAAVNCVFAEFDAAPDGYVLPPSAITESSSGKYHVYWLLDEPFILSSPETMERAKRLQAAWVALVGSDDGAKDLSRVLRPVGTHNYKAKYGPDFPVVSWVHCDLTCIYRLEELEALARPAHSTPLFDAPRETVDPARLTPSEPVRAAVVDLGQYQKTPRPVVVKTLERLEHRRWRDYGDWLKIGQALKTWDEREGLTLWEGFSKLVAPEKYTNGVCREKWPTFKRDDLTLGTLRYWADEDDPPTTDTPTDTPTDRAPRFSIGTEDELMALAPLRFLDRELALVAGAFHLIWGASGSGKTFFAVERAMRQASLGRRVLYIPTEDVSNLRYYVAAWRAAHPAASGRLTFLKMPEGIDLQDPAQVADLLETVEPYAFEHIVLDTLREAHTGDENSSQDTARLNRAIQRLASAGAAVDVVHHSGVAGERPRGSTALFSNANPVIKVEGDDGACTVTVEKIRDVPRDPLRFGFVQQDTGMLDADGQPVIRAVLRPLSQLTTRDSGLSVSQRKVLEILAMSLFADTGAKERQITEQTGMNARTVFRALEALYKRGFITHGAKGDPYTITPSGRAQLGPELTPSPEPTPSPTDTRRSASVRPTDSTDSQLTRTDSQSSDTPTELTDTDTTLRGVSVSQLESVTDHRPRVHVLETADAFEVALALPGAMPQMVSTHATLAEAEAAYERLEGAVDFVAGLGFGARALWRRGLARDPEWATYRTLDHLDPAQVAEVVRRWPERQEV